MVDCFALTTTSNRWRSTHCRGPLECLRLTWSLPLAQWPRLCLDRCIAERSPFLRDGCIRLPQTVGLAWGRWWGRWNASMVIANAARLALCRTVPLALARCAHDRRPLARMFSAWGRWPRIRLRDKLAAICATSCKTRRFMLSWHGDNMGTMGAVYWGCLGSQERNAPKP